jgi:hypothetical protein
VKQKFRTDYTIYNVVPPGSKFPQKSDYQNLTSKPTRFCKRFSVE